MATLLTALVFLLAPQGALPIGLTLLLLETWGADQAGRRFAIGRLPSLIPLKLGSSRSAMPARPSTGHISLPTWAIVLGAVSITMLATWLIVSFAPQWGLLVALALLLLEALIAVWAARMFAACRPFGFDQLGLAFFLTVGCSFTSGMLLTLFVRSSLQVSQDAAPLLASVPSLVWWVLAFRLSRA